MLRWELTFLPIWNFLVTVHFQRKVGLMLFYVSIELRRCSDYVETCERFSCSFFILHFGIR